MNRVSVSSGHLLDGTGTVRSDGNLDVLVSEGFAQAHQLAPGSPLAALVNGKRRTLIVVGIALSPEFIFAGLGARRAHVGPDPHVK